MIDLVAKHRGTPTLVIGQYVDQLDDLAAAAGRPADHRRDDGPAAGAALRGVPVRGDRPAGGQQGRQLLHRPAQRAGRDPGLRRLRLPPGGGPAAGSVAPAQGGRAPRPGSTPWSRGTPSTPTSPPTGSGSWPSRATPTRSWTPKTQSSRHSLFAARLRSPSSLLARRRRACLLARHSRRRRALRSRSLATGVGASGRSRQERSGVRSGPFARLTVLPGRLVHHGYRSLRLLHQGAADRAENGPAQ